MPEEMQNLMARAEALIADHDNMLAELIKLRRMHGLSQEEVGERMGVSQPRVSQFERYDSNPTLDAVRRYAAAVGARLDTRVIDDHASYLPARQQVALIEQAAPDATREISWESHATEVAS